MAYPISYRQLEEMMKERGVSVDHSTLNQWVSKCARILHECVSTPDEATPPLEGPAEPLADATSHDPREVVTLQPREVFGKEGDALVVGTRHPG